MFGVMTDHPGQNRDKLNQALLEETPKKMRPSEIIPYSYPRLSTGKVWFIDFMAYDEQACQMRRKRIKVQHIKDRKQRLRYAQVLIHTLMDRLDQGWSPWSGKPLTQRIYSLDDVFTLYIIYIEREAEQKSLRPDTIKSYKSYLRVFKKWVITKPELSDCSSLSRSHLVEFLDYIHHDLGNSPTTRNNYLVWLVNFCGWCKERDYLQTNVAEGIKHLPKPSEKNRELIDDKTLHQIREWNLANSKGFNLVCQLVFYCFIRPKEISYLRVGDIKIKDNTIFINGEISKNHKSLKVTLPNKIIKDMLNLGIFNFPSSYYIFSKDFLPGEKHYPVKYMQDFWRYHLAKDLKLPKSLKLYSLKDTGITKQLHNTDALSVRNQARHSDISVTNIYAGKEEGCNPFFVDIDDIL